jgi:L-ribulose-5-phosphate 3-epimerase
MTPHPPMMNLDRRSLLRLGAGVMLGPGPLHAASSRPRPLSTPQAAAEAAAEESEPAARAGRRAIHKPEGPRAIQKAVKIEMVGEGSSLREKFQLLVDLGFDGVELSSPNTFDPQEVLAARDATGLTIAGVVDSVHWNLPLNHPDPGVRRRGREGLERAIRDAHLYGGPHVLLVPAVVNAQMPYDLAWQRSRDELRRVLPLAEELGVRISFENVWNHFLLSPLEAARYVDSFPSAQVGWYFDVGNVVLYGWPEHWIRALGTRISRVDVKEFSRAKAQREGTWAGFGVELLEGDCDWPAVMRALDEIGYQGWFVAEVPGGDRARLAEIAARMDRILALE